MSDRGLTFTAAVRVVTRVHDRTADCRADTLVTGLTGFTDLDGIMLNVTDLTDSRLAVEADDPDLTGGEADLSLTVFLSDELSENACRADELCALAGVKLDVVDKSTDRDICYRESVARLDVGGLTGVKDGTVGNSERSYDIALVAGFVLKQGDISGAVGVVLNADNGVGSRIRALIVDDPVLDLFPPPR